eukprot:gene12762-biopygen18514
MLPGPRHGRDRAPVGEGGCRWGPRHGVSELLWAQGDVAGGPAMAVTELLWGQGGVCRSPGEPSPRRAIPPLPFGDGAARLVTGASVTGRWRVTTLRYAFDDKLESVASGLARRVSSLGRACRADGGCRCCVE